MKHIPALFIAAATVALFGCGKAQFEKQEFAATAVASQYTKPKIDILIAQDNSPSMTQPVATVKTQLDSFLNGMDSRWDFHFTVVPLQKVYPLASKYIVAQNCSDIRTQYCIPASNKAAFNNTPSGTEYGWINTIDQGTGNFDEGFKNLKANLQHADMVNTGFLRPDAALAVIVLSNGEDVSNMVYPQDWMDRGDGVMVPNFNSANAVNSFNDFRDTVSTLKGGLGMARFYGVVARNNYSNCYGGPTWQGTRYMNMANALSGNHYELCNGELSTVLSNIKYQLDALVEAYRFNYVVIDGDPVESSIVVKKNGATVPKSTTNGWSFVGYKSNQPISYYPQLSNFKSGYMIKMNGTAEYSGTDVINVTFQKK